jgi:hypothetical protein
MRIPLLKGRPDVLAARLLPQARRMARNGEEPVNRRMMQKKEELPDASRLLSGHRRAAGGDFKSFGTGDHRLPTVWNRHTDLRDTVRVRGLS